MPADKANSRNFRLLVAVRKVVISVIDVVSMEDVSTIALLNVRSRITISRFFVGKKVLILLVELVHDLVNYSWLHCVDAV